MQKAAAKLKRLLNYKKIKPVGTPFLLDNRSHTTSFENCKGEFDFCEERSTEYRVGVLRIKEPRGIVFLDANSQKAFCDSFELKVSELKAYIPTKENAPSTNKQVVDTSDYSTPYLELLNIMIKKGYVSKVDQPKKYNLIEDIKKEAKEADIEVSNRIADCMATMLRLPEKQKGGQIKQTK